MGKFAGGALRSLSTLLYVLEFCCAAIALGIFSYFLAKLSYHDLPIAQRWRAVEGLVGSATLYTIFAVLLTCFLGGNRFFGFLAIVLNIAFCAAMIAVAVLTRDGASSCRGVLNTPLGVGPTNVERAGTNQGYACRLNTVVFAVSLIAAFLFLLSAIFQIFMVRHHQKEKKFGPSPANGYTSGSGRGKFWKRKPKTTTTKDATYTNGHNAELGTAGTHGRPSHETAYTGTTAGHSDNVAHNKYDTPATHDGPYTAPHSGYNTGPTGTSVNPYGYQNQPATGTATNY